MARNDRIVPVREISVESPSLVANIPRNFDFSQNRLTLACLARVVKLCGCVHSAGACC
jgi:hypothetical protein